MNHAAASSGCVVQPALFTLPFSPMDPLLDTITGSFIRTVLLSASELLVAYHVVLLNECTPLGDLVGLSHISQTTTYSSLNSLFKFLKHLSLWCYIYESKCFPPKGK